VLIKHFRIPAYRSVSPSLSKQYLSERQIFGNKVVEKMKHILCTAYFFRRLFAFRGNETKVIEHAILMLHLIFKERAKTKTSVHRRFTASIDVVRFSALLSYMTARSDLRVSILSGSVLFCSLLSCMAVRSNLQSVGGVLTIVLMTNMWL
jgi:hypothetical protein